MVLFLSLVTSKTYLAMARKAKIDNSVLKRFSREEKVRPFEIREKRKYFLIVCEGVKTEPLYFDALSNDLPPRVLSVFNFEIDGAGKNTMSLVDHALQKSEKASINYDEVWVVFDRDSFTPAQFNAAIAKADAYNIRTAWSNEAFELWYLLHFIYTDAAISREQYKPILEREIKKTSGKTFTYKKNDPAMYQILKELGDHHKAIRFAAKLDRKWNDQKFNTHNPSTKVYKLVARLCALSTEMHCKS